MALSSIQKKTLRAVGAAAVIALCVVFFRGVDWSKLREAVVGARWHLIVLAAILNFVHLLIKAGRWGILLSPVGRVGLLSLFRYMLGGYAASNLLPARFGEVLRVFYLRPHGIPAARAAGVQVLEKVYEVVSLLLLVLPLPFVLPLPRAASDTIGLLAVAGLVATPVMVWMGRHHRIPRQGLLARIGEGMVVLREPRGAMVALVLSLLIWVTDAGEVMLVMAGVGIAPTFFLAMLVLLFINFAIALPSTPAQVGIFEAGAVGALSMFGVGMEKALAFALLYHFMQAIPVTLAGAEALVLWRSLRAAPAPTPAEEPAGRPG